MSKITQKDIDLIKQQDNQTLASWWGLLNKWKWPEELPNPEPPEYIKNGRRGKIMSYIEKIIGLKACLQCWNINRMTKDEFEEFWRNGINIQESN